MRLGYRQGLVICNKGSVGGWKGVGVVVTFEGSEQLKMFLDGEVGIQDVVLRAHAEVLTNVRHLFIDVHA